MKENRTLISWFFFFFVFVSIIEVSRYERKQFSIALDSEERLTVITIGFYCRHVSAKSMLYAYVATQHALFVPGAIKRISLALRVLKMEIYMPRWWELKSLCACIECRICCPTKGLRESFALSARTYIHIV